MSTVCAARIVVAGTLKRGAFGSERGQSKLERGRSATSYRFGENPAGHPIFLTQFIFGPFFFED